MQEKDISEIQETRDLGSNLEQELQRVQSRLDSIRAHTDLLYSTQSPLKQRMFALEGDDFAYVFDLKSQIYAVEDVSLFDMSTVKPGFQEFAQDFIKERGELEAISSERVSLETQRFELTKKLTEQQAQELLQSYDYTALFEAILSAVVEAADDFDEQIDIKNFITNTFIKIYSISATVFTSNDLLSLSEYEITLKRIAEFRKELQEEGMLLATPKEGTFDAADSKKEQASLVAQIEAFTKAEAARNIIRLQQVYRRTTKSVFDVTDLILQTLQHFDKDEDVIDTRFFKECQEFFDQKLELFAKAFDFPQTSPDFDRNKKVEQVSFEGIPQDKGERTLVHQDDLKTMIIEEMPDHLLEKLDAVVCKRVAEDDPDDDGDTLGLFQVVSLDKDNPTVVSMFKVNVYQTPVLEVGTTEASLYQQKHEWYQTFWHEVGHGAHYMFTAHEIQKWEAVVEQEQVLLNSYVRSSKKEDEGKGLREDFATAFSMYKEDPAVLKKVAPLRFAFIDRYFLLHLEPARYLPLHYRNETAIVQLDDLCIRKGYTDQNIKDWFTVPEEIVED